jgi:hypothetical protein
MQASSPLNETMAHQNPVEISKINNQPARINFAQVQNYTQVSRQKLFQKVYQKENACNC